MQRVWSMTLAHFTARFCGSSSMKTPGSGFGESELYHARKKRKHARAIAGQVIGGDRGRLARKRDADPYLRSSPRIHFRASRSFAGGTPRGPNRTLDRLSSGCCRLTNAQGHKKLALVNLLFVCDCRSRALLEVLDASYYFVTCYCGYGLRDLDRLQFRRVEKCKNFTRLPVGRTRATGYGGRCAPRHRYRAKRFVGEGRSYRS